MNQEPIAKELLEPALVVIDELLDRTSEDDGKSTHWASTDFPLVPFPFFEKNRLPENIGIEDDWMGYWLDIELFRVIGNRYKTIEWLREQQLLSVQKDPVLNFGAGLFDGDSYQLTILDRKLLIAKKDWLNDQIKQTKKADTSASSQPTTKTDITLKIEKPKTIGQPVLSIECVIKDPSNNVFQVVVNHDYGHPLKATKKDKNNWDLVYRIATEKIIHGDLDLWKDKVEYFNYNKACAIYTQTGCKLTTIFQLDPSGKIEALIPIEQIDWPTYLRRKNKKH